MTPSETLRYGLATLEKDLLRAKKNNGVFYSVGAVEFLTKQIDDYKKAIEVLEGQGL